MKRTWAGLLVWLAALLASAAQAGTIIYYHNDLAGSPAVATNASGQVIWRESYRPYGERLTNAPASASNDVWFTSRRQDAETGFVYMGARYYDPVAGRFNSVDPVAFDEGNVQSHNRYAYANNNPYRYVDPDGRTPADVGFALWDGGNFLGAAAAWGVGAITGNAALRQAGAEGMRENALDAGVSVGSIFLPVSSGLVKGAIKAADNTSDAIATANRAESIAKGIPESLLGPSGLPKLHVVKHGGKEKQAEEAARREFGKGGSVEKHSNPKEGGSHYHGVSQSGEKSRIHHEFD